MDEQTIFGIPVIVSDLVPPDQLWVMAQPALAHDVGGRPYCADCGDSGSGPCLYHRLLTQRRVAQVKLDAEYPLVGAD